MALRTGKLLFAAQGLASLARAGASLKACTAGGEACSSEDVPTSLLQVRMTEAALAGLPLVDEALLQQALQADGAQAPAPGVTNLTKVFTGTCDPGISAKIQGIQIGGDDTLKYSIASLDGNSACREEETQDAPGPSACCLGWNSTVSLDYDVATSRNITAGWKFSVFAKIFSQLPFFGWVEVGKVDFACHVCGQPCKVPAMDIAGGVKIKARTLDTPDCDGLTTSVNGTQVILLPEKSPAPVKARVTGQVKLMDEAGQLVASASALVEAFPGRR